jgi:hypothetical protein
MKPWDEMTADERRYWVECYVHGIWIDLPGYDEEDRLGEEEE